MERLKLDINFTDYTPHFWDNYWDNEMGKSKKDPDVDCKLLQQYHKELWSKELPNGEKLELTIGIGPNYLTWKDFRFGSDSIIVSYRYEKFKNTIKEVMDYLPNYKDFIVDYVKKSYTMGGFIIFPKENGGINQTRGCNPFIRDRFDLTLECIRKFYLNEQNPLSDVLNKNKRFFDLFVDFKGYVDYFYLQDLVSSDYKNVEIWIGKGDLKENPFPNSVEEYLNLIKQELKFVELRNNRINRAVNNC